MTGSKFDTARSRAWDLAALWQEPTQVAHELTATLLDLEDDPEVVQWLRQGMTADPERGQFLWRSAWSVFSQLELEDGGRLVLGGLPCYLDSYVWDTRAVAQELSAWCAAEFNCELVIANPAPTPLKGLMSLAPARSLQYAHELLVSGVGGWDLGGPEGQASAVWPVVVLADEQRARELVSRLAQPIRPSISFTALKNRMEALAEEQDVDLSLAPFASWANGHSLAVALGLSRWAVQNGGQPQSWGAAYRWPELELSDGTRQFTLPLSVESRTDVTKALGALGRSRKFSYTLS